MYLKEHMHSFEFTFSPFALCLEGFKTPGSKYKLNMRPALPALIKVKEKGKRWLHFYMHKIFKTSRISGKTQCACHRGVKVFKKIYDNFKLKIASCSTVLYCTVSKYCTIDVKPTH